MANYVLEILDGDRAGEVVPVASTALRIGRKPGNDLVLADEKTSGVHAEVVLEGDRHVLRDLGSTNGTFLDGKRVTEIVLTPGDVVTVGRLRVKFRAEGEAAPTDAGELAVRRLDAARAGGRSGSVGLLAAVLVVALGAGGWFWWQNRAAASGDGATAVGKKGPLDVPGNKLAAAVANCESEDGWIRAGGAPFPTGVEANTGSGGLVARIAEGAPNFAVVRTKDALSVLAMRPFTLAAHVRTRGGGQVALRALVTAANEQSPFAFRTGTAFTGHDEWTRVQCTIAVPPGCDRLQLEVAALLPNADAQVLVDDVAITEGGDGTALETKLVDGQTVLGTVIGTGSAMAIRSVDPDNPATLVAALPATVPGPLQELQRAGLCALSDLGASIACTPGEGRMTVEAKGATDLQLVFPADAASGLLVGDANQVFTSTAAQSSFQANSLLVGERLTRAWLGFDQALACSGTLGGGRFVLTVPVSRFELRLSFRSERGQAMEAVRAAKGARDEGRLGDALDRLRDTMAKLPMDTDVLGQAAALRSEILAGQAAMLARLQKDLDQASFFTTRGGFERVALGVEALVRLYGEANVQDSAAVQALRDAAKKQLAAIDGESHGQQRLRLQLLAKAFGEASQPGLAQIVQRYIDTHLGN